MTTVYISESLTSRNCLLTYSLKSCSQPSVHCEYLVLVSVFPRWKCMGKHSLEEDVLTNTLLYVSTSVHQCVPTPGSEEDGKEADDLSMSR